MKTYKVWVAALNAEILRSTLNEQIDVVENKVTAFYIISLLWHLKISLFM